MKALTEPTQWYEVFFLFMETLEQVFVCFFNHEWLFNSSDCTRVLVLFCISYIVVAFVALWIQESGIKEIYDI